MPVEYVGPEIHLFERLAEARLRYVAWINNLHVGDTVALHYMSIADDIACQNEFKQRALISESYHASVLKRDKEAVDPQAFETQSVATLKFNPYEMDHLTCGYGYEAGVAVWVGYHPEPLYRVIPLHSELLYHRDVGYFVYPVPTISEIATLQKRGQYQQKLKSTPHPHAIQIIDYPKIEPLM
jgi:hypothetical protein